MEEGEHRFMSRESFMSDCRDTAAEFEGRIMLLELAHAALALRLLRACGLSGDALSGALREHGKDIEQLARWLLDPPEESMLALRVHTASQTLTPIPPEPQAPPW